MKQGGSDKGQRGSAHRCSAGFTLLELLVGMAVFAVMAGIVLGGIRLGVRSWDAAAERSASVEEMRVAHALLRRQLSSALPLAASRAGGWKLVFDGSAQSVQFISELPGYVAGGGVNLITLEVAETMEGKNLVLRWRPLHAIDADAPPNEAVLARNISDARLDYFGARERGALPEWRDNWRDSRTLPRLIKLSLRGKQGEIWPELMVELGVNAVRFVSSPASGGRTAPDSDAAASMLKRSL